MLYVYILYAFERVIISFSNLYLHSMIRIYFSFYNNIILRKIFNKFKILKSLDSYFQINF